MTLISYATFSFRKKSAQKTSNETKMFKNGNKSHNHMFITK